QLPAQLDSRGERGGTRPFGEIVRRAKREADAICELLLGQCHDVVRLAFKDAKGEVKGHTRCHAFGERVGAIPGDTAATAIAASARPRSRKGVGALRLDTDDFRTAPDAAPDDRAATVSAAATNRHEYHVGVGHLLEYLERVRADARQEQRLVRRMHISKAAGM